MEHFIARVRCYPCLWNVNHISYRNFAQKDIAWERVAKECGMVSGKEAKFQWKKLRDSHREAMRRRKCSLGQIQLPWKYEQEMEFLLTHPVKREVYPNFPYEGNVTQESITDNNEEATNTPIEFIPVQLPETELPASSPVESVSRIPKIECYSMLDEREKMRSTDSNNSTPDALSNLFTSLCQKTRELPKYLQLRVQRDIFEIVTRAEEEALSFESE